MMPHAAAGAGGDAARQARAQHLLAQAGLWGALLTLVVLGASVFMRLTTGFDPAGEPVSALPDGVETFARLSHRIAAMAVSILALLATFAVASIRPVTAGRLAAVGSILALTVVLAVLGRFTTGYRIPEVTLGNVAGGMALACAFWWLHEQGARAGAGRGKAPLEWAALALVLLQAGLGASASAWAMRGDFAAGPWHGAAGIATAALLCACAWRHRDRRGTRALAALLAAGSLVQLVIGFALAVAQPERPLAFGWLHAMLACALALGLAALAARTAAQDSAR